LKAGKPEGTTHDHGITCRLMAWYFDKT